MQSLDLKQGLNNRETLSLHPAENVRCLWFCFFVHLFCQQVHVLKYKTLFLNLYQTSLYFEGCQILISFSLDGGHILKFFSSLR